MILNSVWLNRTVGVERDLWRPSRGPAMTKLETLRRFFLLTLPGEVCSYIFPELPFIWESFIVFQLDPFTIACFSDTLLTKHTVSEKQEGMLCKGRGAGRDCPSHQRLQASHTRTGEQKGSGGHCTSSKQ